MHFSTPNALVLALAASHAAHAHTLFTNFFVDGVGQGDGTCVRMPKDPSTATAPIADISSNDMVCGRDGTTGVARVCSANASSTLTFEYRDWPDDASRGAIDISHKGPCAVYLKKVDSAVSDSGTGDGWFKIWEEGYDESAGKWCTEKLIDNKGHLSVNLPSDVAGGYYLVRPEVLALHQADKTPSDPQLYVGCAQVFLKSAGTATPSNTVSIPGHVAEGQPGLKFNIWATPMALPYPMPGPAVYQSTTKRDLSARTVQTSQSEGLKPANCVLENANWCGTEIAQYSGESACWSASTACWDQATTCYNTAPPTGSKNCKIWEDKCTAIQKQCGAGNFNGPPDYMKILTPAVASVSLPAASPAQVGNGDAAASAPASSAPVSSAPASSAPASSAPASYAAAPSVQSSSAAAVPTTLAVSASGIPVAAASSTSAAASSQAAASSPTTSSASSPSSAAGLNISTDGSCGNGVTCQGSPFGDCCSSHGYCGSSPSYCATGCDSTFGTCNSAPSPTASPAITSTATTATVPAGQNQNGYGGYRGWRRERRAAKHLRVYRHGFGGKDLAAE